MSTLEAQEEKLDELKRTVEHLSPAEPPPRTWLEILERSDRERHWNAILGYFLQPRNPHGFGDEVLTKFLEFVSNNADDGLSVERVDPDNIEVRVEKPTTEGNIPDLVLYESGEWFICGELKVGASETGDQTERYAEDDQIGTEDKSTFDQHYYIYLTKQTAAPPASDRFTQVYWSDLLERLRGVQGRHFGHKPFRSSAQFEDFLETIDRSTSETMRFDENEQKRMELFVENADWIRELEDSFDNIYNYELENWWRPFLEDYRPESWKTADWKVSKSDSCHIYHPEWRLNSSFEQTESGSDAAVNIYLLHTLKNRSHVLDGRFKLRLKYRGPNIDTEFRNEFYDRFDSAETIREIAQQKEITILTQGRGRASYAEKEYYFPKSGFPDTFYDQLREAFNEFAPIRVPINNILTEMVELRREA